MNIKQIKLIVIAIITIPLLAVAILNLNTSAVRADATNEGDASATYKAKCAACHGPAAAKFYDPEMAMEEQVEAILKGKKGAKPPFMPAFEAKGVTAEQAQELAEFMKNLRTPPGE